VTDKNEQIQKLIYSLSNQLMVIDKSFKVYADNLPKHRLTEITQHSLVQTKEIVKELKVLLSMEMKNQVKLSLIKKNLHTAMEF
jgi:hypothetical protein